MDAPEIRVADQVELVMQQVAELESQKAELERQRKAIIAGLEPVVSVELSGQELAEIYWRFETVPVQYLGNPPDVLRVARQYPYWSWRCLGCGEEVFVTSRSDKRQRESKRNRDYPPTWICDDCRASEWAKRHVDWEAQKAQLHERQRHLRTMPYRDFLQTPEWQTTRKAALKRAGYACQVCNRRRQLHVHHRTYERRGAELARDLVVLCDECHALYHRKGLLAPHEDGEE